MGESIKWKCFIWMHKINVKGRGSNGLLEPKHH